MEQTGSRPSKAEELFYFLRQLAGCQDVIDMEEVRRHFLRPTALSALYLAIKKLEAHGAIERIMDGDSRGNSIARLKFLKTEVSILQGKRGRKPGSKNAKKEALPPAEAVVAQQTSLSASISKQTAGVSIPLVAKPAVSLRTVVFIDENQLIMSELEGRTFNLGLVLEKVKAEVGDEIERVFIYCSETTEKKNLPLAQSLFRQDRSLLRFVKTGSQPGVVDRRIREDIELWSRIDFVSTIVLGTADGGPDFLAAIAKVKESGKKLILLKAGGSFNTTLRRLANGLTDGSSPHPLRRSFEEIIVAVKDGDFYSGDLNSRLILVITLVLKEFFKTGKEAQFGEIVQHIQTIIKARREFEGYAKQDLREAVNALIHTGRLLQWRRESGKNLYRLAVRCALLEAMEEFAPASLRART